MPGGGGCYDKGGLREAYVEQLLAPSLLPGQVMVVDNLGAHMGERIGDRRAGLLAALLAALLADRGSLSKVKALLGKA